jgi:AcrR family transcriptional regulator
MNERARPTNEPSQSSTAAAAGTPDAAAWIQAGIKLLVRENMENVQIESAASLLGVPARQFYQHFKTTDEFHSAILERWFLKTTVGICERAEREGSTAYERLKRLLELPFWSTKIGLAADLELAIRDWARRSASAREAVGRADEVRLRYLTQLFVALSFEEHEATVRSREAYALVRYLTQITQTEAGLLHEIIRSGLNRLTER